MPTEKGMGVLVYDGKKMDIIKYNQIGGNYPGIGDFFTGTFYMNLLSGREIMDAVKNSINKTYEEIEKTNYDFY